MPATSVSGQDIAQIDGIILATLADGNAFDVTFPNDLGNVKAGKNGNTIYAKNEMGRMCDVTLRVLLGNADDKYLNSRMQQWISDPSSFSFLVGMFVKRVGDGQGNLSSKIYNCTGGVFMKQVEMKTSAEGDAEQNVAVYTLRFGSCQVSLQ
jgi:hypothetical protein